MLPYSLSTNYFYIFARDKIETGLNFLFFIWSKYIVLLRLVHFINTSKQFQKFWKAVFGLWIKYESLKEFCLSFYGMRWYRKFCSLWKKRPLIFSNVSSKREKVWHIIEGDKTWWEQMLDIGYGSIFWYMHKAWRL